MKKNLDEEATTGMTVNERLYVAGLIDDFDEAVAEKDKSRLKSILERIYLSPENDRVSEFKLNDCSGSLTSE